MRTSQRLGCGVGFHRRFLRFRKLRQRSLDIEKRLRLHLDHRQLPGRRQPANYFSHLRSRCQGRQKALGIVRRRGNHRLQIYRNQHRQRGDLRHTDARIHRLLVPRLEWFPQRFLTFRLIERNYSQRRPKLMQRAQHGCFGEFLAEFLLNFCSGQHPALFQQLPNVRDKRRDAVCPGSAGSVLPIAVAAQGIHKRQCLLAHQKIRVIGCGAKQVQWQRRAGLDQAHEQPLGRLDRPPGRRRRRLAETGLNERRSRRGNLRLAGKKQTQTRLEQPGLRVLQGQQRLGSLPPERRAGCQKLFRCQREPFRERAGFGALSLEKST